MRLLVLLLALLLSATNGWGGQFYGELGLDPNPADASGRTRILHANFGFEDADGLRWRANKGDITDGASIPGIFVPFIGDPFDDRFVKAAVIHDRYCDRKHNVRPWRNTHRMFYDALLAAGVPTGRAKVMYYAVYTFGPRWDKLSKGAPCGLHCTNMQPEFNEVHRGDTYDDASHADELAAATAEIEERENGEGITLDQIEAMSDARHPDDIFLKFSITQ